MIRFDLGFRTVDGSFWGTVLYSLVITGFGIHALIKYPDSIQQKRYKMLIGYQLLFLFGIPELLAPALIHSSSFVHDLFAGARGWHFLFFKSSVATQHLGAHRCSIMDRNQKLHCGTELDISCSTYSFCIHSSLCSKTRAEVLLLSLWMWWTC
jgi:hypothetical protein